jgi:FKBP-type peptidyl-prolyl cis-trans isomerase
MAYGEREAGDKIKPYSTLIFVIDLISVDKK